MPINIMVISILSIRILIVMRQIKDYNIIKWLNMFKKFVNIEK